jgi:hypothetical protein
MIQVASTVVDCLIHMTKISWAKIFQQGIRTQVACVPVSYLAAYAINLYVKEDLLTKMKQKEYDGFK